MNISKKSTLAIGLLLALVYPAGMPRAHAAIYFFSGVRIHPGSTIIAHGSTSAEEAQEQAETDQQQKLKEKAVELLVQVATDAALLQLAENRILVQATAADLLWAHDEKRARDFFISTFYSLKQTAPPIDGKDLRGSNRYPLQLRQMVLRMIARRDPGLASELSPDTHTLPSRRSTSNKPPGDGRAERRPRQPVRTPADAGDRETDRLWYEYNNLLRSGNLEEAVAAVDKAPPEMRSLLYQQVAARAAGKGDVDRARQIIKDKITDRTTQGRMLTSLDRPTPERLLAQGDLEGARQMLSQIASPEERAVRLVRLATLAAGKDGKKAAQHLLEEARSVAGGQPNDGARFNAQLEIARAYALIEPARGFDVIEPMVDKLNELAAAAATLDGFLPGQKSFRDGELILQDGSISNTFRRLAEVLALLAQTDFDRSKATAYRFRQPEMRFMALLLVAQSILSGVGRPAAIQLQDPRR